MSKQTPRPERSFGPVAEAYDRARPSYPEEAVRWLVGSDSSMVLELGAGTGKLTEVLHQTVIRPGNSSSPPTRSPR